MKKISCFIGFLLLAVLISAPFWPWKMWAHHAIVQQLASKKIEVDFTVEDIFPGRLILRNIEIKDFPTKFDLLDVRYSARELVSKRLAISTLSLQSKDGEVTTQNVNIDLFRPSETALTLDIKNVPLDFIMRLLTGNRAKATGNVSGKFPLVLHKDRSITVGNATMSTLGAGTLIVAPDAIPGDNEQVTLIRSALSNFHYQEFALQADSTKDKKLSILLQLRGNNPDVYNGREIKLNVRLQGDLIETFMQSVSTMTDPMKFLEQKK